MSAAMISRSNITSKIALVLALVGVAGLVAAPWWGTTATMRLITEFMFYLALASMWNLLAGYAGLLSVGQHAYVGLGGYVLFSVVLFLGISPLWALPIAAVVGAALSLPVAWLVFRLKGPYFAIGTWVVADVFRLAFAQMTSVGGGSGLSLPASAMKSIGSKSEREMIIYFAALAVCLGAVVVIYLLLRSRVGLALTAIRDNETASSSLGINIGRIKLMTYVITAAATATVGVLIFLTKLRISPEAAFSMNDWTVFVILIVVIGGIGTIEGPILGTILYFLLREYLADLGAIYLLILGLLSIVIMLWAPKGIWGLVVKRFDLSLFPVGYRIRQRDG
ncbi:MAG: branched-chain amino acid ABC transporter permease [Rhodobacterales bacterium]|nr:branched-chain amino acid ABC transporter permease [Rhodobacterales bacterium]